MENVKQPIESYYDVNAQDQVVINAKPESIKGVTNRDEDKDQDFVVLAAFWALSAIIFNKQVPIFKGLVFVGGILVGITVVGTLWEQGQILWSVVFAFILISAIGLRSLSR